MIQPPTAPIPRLETRPVRPQPIPPLPPPAPPPDPPPGFLPVEQWQYIQDFNTEMARVKIETCTRCQERWFSMDLKDSICHACFLRDKGCQTPFLMSAENDMDPGELPAGLPKLTQVEEMIIARSHVQMLLYRYRGH